MKDKLKKIGNGVYMGCDIHILPTDKPLEKGQLIFSTLKPYVLQTSSRDYTLDGWSSQHMYITCNGGTKEGYWNEGVWFLDLFNTPRQATDKTIISPNDKEIISSTDKSLGLPSPSDEFILEFIEHWNKFRPIKRVLVEYEEYCEKLSCDNINCLVHCNDVKERIKINPKDNTITIKPVKDSWTKEEVKQLIIDAVGESHDWSKENNDIHSIGIIQARFLNNWFDNKL